MENESQVTFGIENPSAEYNEDALNLIFGDPFQETKKDDTPTPPTPSKKTVKAETKEETEEVVEVVEPTIEDLFTEEAPVTEQEETETEDTTAEGDTFKNLSEELFSLGVFTEGENEAPITTPEEFKERFDKEISAQSNQRLMDFLSSKHGEDGIEAFRAIFVNGVTPQEYMAAYATIDSVKDLDLAIETNQEKVFREYHRSIGLSDNNIEKKLQKAKDYGDLEEDVKEYQQLLIQGELEELQEVANERAANQQRKQLAQQQYHQALTSTLSEVLKAKELDGIPVTPKVANTVFDMMYNEKHPLQDGSKLTEYERKFLELRRPSQKEDLLKAIKIALLLENNFDFSKIKAKAVSNETNKIFTKLVTRETKASSKNPPAPKNNNTFII